MKHLVIIGNGVSGVTLARHVRKRSDMRITIISDETSYFFSRTALMYVYMGHMRFKHTQPYENGFWKKNKINLIQALVQKVNTKDQCLYLDSEEKVYYDFLVIASGSKPNKYGWPGQDLPQVMGMYHRQDLEKLESISRNIKSGVVVGGGLIGIELAEMLHSRGKKVTFLVREDSFWNGVLPAEESEMVNRQIRDNHINLKLSTNLVEIKADDNGNVNSVTTDKQESISCQMVGLTAGVSPNIDFLKDSGIETQRGVMVNRKLETNVPNVYGIGDCAQQYEAIGLRRPVEAVWYTGRKMGEALAQTLTGSPTDYEPGHWFNSAKFFDLEYQTYGWVWAKPKDYEQQIYWEHASGKKALRFSIHKETGEFLGVNTFGIRLRHEYFETVLDEKWSIEKTLKYLPQANFDPEFYQKHETEISASLKNNLTTI